MVGCAVDGWEYEGGWWAWQWMVRVVLRVWRYDRDGCGQLPLVSSALFTQVCSAWERGVWCVWYAEGWGREGCTEETASVPLCGQRCHPTCYCKFANYTLKSSRIKITVVIIVMYNYTGKVMLAYDVTSSQSSLLPAICQCNTGQHCDCSGMYSEATQLFSMLDRSDMVHPPAPTHKQCYTHTLTHTSPMQFVLEHILKAPPQLYSQWLDLRQLPQVTTELPQQAYLFGMPVWSLVIKLLLFISCPTITSTPPPFKKQGGLGITIVSVDWLIRDSTKKDVDIGPAGSTYFKYRYGHACAFWHWPWPWLALLPPRPIKVGLQSERDDPYQTFPHSVGNIKAANLEHNTILLLECPQENCLQPQLVWSLAQSTIVFWPLTFNLWSLHVTSTKVLNRYVSERTWLIRPLPLALLEMILYVLAVKLRPVWCGTAERRGPLCVWAATARRRVRNPAQCQKRPPRTATQLTTMGVRSGAILGWGRRVEKRSRTKEARGSVHLPSKGAPVELIRQRAGERCSSRSRWEQPSHSQRSWPVTQWSTRWESSRDSAPFFSVQKYLGTVVIENGTQAFRFMRFLGSRFLDPQWNGFPLSVDYRLAIS